MSSEGVMREPMEGPKNAAEIVARSQAEASSHRRETQETIRKIREEDAKRAAEQRKRRSEIMYGGRGAKVLPSREEQDAQAEAFIQATLETQMARFKDNIDKLDSNDLKKLQLLISETLAIREAREKLQN